MKMNGIMKSTLKRIPACSLLLAVCIISLAIQPITASGAGGATQIPVLWTAGGLSAGTDSAGQAARIASDASGNVAVVSGPSGGRDLAVTSYTADGILRWRSTVSPSTGTFVGDWLVAAHNGDLVVIGHNQDSHGRPIASTMLRYASDGALLWRVDFSAAFYPAVARLVVDTAGNAYVAWSAVGSGLFVQKYSPSGDLLWSQQDSSTGGGYAIASSLALSPDDDAVAVTGSISGGATWITAVYDATTGVRRWQATAAEGTAALDVVMDASHVYVTGQGATGAGTPALTYYLSVVAYDRETGARLWRTDKKPADGASASGLRMAMAPDGSLVVSGQAARGFLDWYTVAFETTGTVLWEAVRDGGLNTDEIPRGLLVMADGTTVVTGRGGPTLQGGYWPGVTVGYGPSGTLLWEAFSAMETTWATALPNNDVCASGGYDALITCFRVSGELRAVMSAMPSTGTAPLGVTFDGSGSTTPSGTITSWTWSFGDGATGTGPQTTHLYPTPGTYTASLTVTDSNGASSTATSSIVVTPLPPAAPSGLTASLSGNLVQLAWQDNSSNETVFYIERCQGAGCTNFASFVATQWPDVPSYTDYSAVTGQRYNYRVRAYNAGGYSPYSNIASILTGVVNQPPTAVISATPSTGAAPLTITFSSAGSSDPDGSIASYSWNFGDGTTSTATNPSHIYASSGTYTATLTITDNGGYTASKSVAIKVTDPAKVLWSTNIVLSATRQSNKVTATGNVTVKNQASSAIQGATVRVIWTLPNGTARSQTATTNSSGIATLTITSNPGTYTLKVTNITKTGYTFDSAGSVLTKSITK